MSPFAHLHAPLHAPLFAHPPIPSVGARRARAPTGVLAGRTNFFRTNQT
jgi:hypothetical protein